MIWSGESRLRVAGTQERRIFFLLPLKKTEMIREGHVIHLHDEHGDGGGDQLYSPQGVILYHCLLKFSSLLAFRLSARV